LSISIYDVTFTLEAPDDWGDTPHRLQAYIDAVEGEFDVLSITRMSESDGKRTVRSCRLTIRAQSTAHVTIIADRLDELFVEHAEGTQG
jgi:hypothetical protein